MKTNYLILAAAALALAACNKQEVAPAVSEESAEVAVGFDAYTFRGVSTRAGYAGEITTDKLKNDNDLKGDGFGVFAYYTDNGKYDDTSIPNFMYNQQVTSSGDNWTYSPVKYWPNEYKKNAISDEKDLLTFFAYAPYVEVVPSTGKLTADAEDQTWGITGLTRNTAPSDPMVKYVVSFDPEKSVDLIWGVNNTCATGEWSTTSTDEQSFTKGLPWLNVERPLDATGASQKVKFTFDHATSKLNVQIAYYADKADNTASETIDATETKIYVRSVTFTGIATKGSLNLNNTDANTAYWMDYAGANDLEAGESVTIFDGRKDGKEGIEGAVAANEKLTGLNPSIIQTKPYGTGEIAGVTQTLKNLFNDDTTPTTPIYVIPTGEEVDVEIVYDVETKDNNLSGYLSDGVTHGSTIENRIYKKAVLGDDTGFENGKAYILKLYLGMNSVKIDAEVTPWGPATGATETPVDLPANTNN